MALALVTAWAFVLASHTAPAAAQTAAQSDNAVFTIIVTRHGVRAITPPGSYNWTAYAWADWSDLHPDDLTRHGYRLMKLMGEFYREAQGGKSSRSIARRKLRSSTRTRPSGRSPRRMR